MLKKRIDRDSQPNQPKSCGLMLKFRSSSGLHMEIVLPEATLLKVFAWVTAVAVGGTAGAGWWAIQQKPPTSIEPAPIEIPQPQK